VVTDFKNQLELLEKLGRGEVEIDLADCGERVLGADTPFIAQAIIRLISFDTPAERTAAWSRFVRQIERIYGPEWRSWKALGEQRSLICNRGRQGRCTELALNGLCDQCLANGS
jgi:hypothetical protein